MRFLFQPNNLPKNKPEGKRSILVFDEYVSSLALTVLLFVRPRALLLEKYSKSFKTASVINSMLRKTQETIAETSEEDLPKATPKARSVKNKATRKKQLERQAAKAESINTTSEEELFKEPQMIKTKDVNR